MSMKYVGINYDSCHDSTVALLGDKVEFVGQEERFSRAKKDGRPPKLALAYLRDNYDLEGDDVRFAFPIMSEEGSDAEWQRSGLTDVYDGIKQHRQYGLDFAYSITKNPIFVRHHDAHAASAYFTSGFRGSPTLICTADGGNFFDPYSINAYEGCDGKITPLERVPSTDWAQRYSLITAALGFRPVHHEGKITGLSAHGSYNQALVDKLRELLKNPSELGGKVNAWVNLGDTEKVPTIRVTDGVEVFEEITNNFSREDIAFAIQHITEEDIKAFLQPYVGKYRKIALAGGIFANVKINSTIKDMGFDHVFIHPAMGDDGLALGAALWAKSENERLLPFSLKNVFFGVGYDQDRVLDAAKKSGLSFTVSEDVEREVAEQLASGKIVARYAGRGEYGPRALGHRSILCRADDASINDSLNKKLKRTEFMPFAPVVCDYQAEELFEGLSGAKYAAAFMTITRNCTELMKKIAPAAVHIDGTARPQIVEPWTDESYYKILNIFNKLVEGQSVLINTSFNMHGEPIVDTPEGAIASFKASKLDVLAMENLIFTQS